MRWTLSFPVHETDRRATFLVVQNTHPLQAASQLQMLYLLTSNNLAIFETAQQLPCPWYWWRSTSNTFYPAGRTGTDDLSRRLRLFTGADPSTDRYFARSIGLAIDPQQVTPIQVAIFETAQQLPSSWCVTLFAWRLPTIVPTSWCQSKQRCRIGLRSRMPSSVYGSPRRPKAPQLYTLRLFADR